MSKRSKLVVKILSGTSDANIDFDELCRLLGDLVRNIIVKYKLAGVEDE